MYCIVVLTTMPMTVLREQEYVPEDGEGADEEEYGTSGFMAGTVEETPAQVSRRLSADLRLSVSAVSDLLYQGAPVGGGGGGGGGAAMVSAPVTRGLTQGERPVGSKRPKKRNKNTGGADTQFSTPGASKRK